MLTAAALALLLMLVYAAAALKPAKGRDDQ